jgi:GDPmannose 4,6-dehydratase
MKAIVFGITGQDGSYLADLLINKGYEVIGVSRRCSTDNTQRIKHLLDADNFKLIEGDITDASNIYNILSWNDHVDEIYNLAAQSHVGTSFSQPALTWDITGKGCLTILQAIVDLGLYNTRFYQASSSEMFGSSYDTNACGEKYQDEDTKFMPNSPYAIAKCAAHHFVRLFRNAHNLHASSGILFNHESPRRGDNFVTQKIINWIANYVRWTKHVKYNGEIKFDEDNIIINGQIFPKLRLGNLEAFRDWGYAGEYVEAMWLMLQQDYPDDYVICTGKTHTVAEFLDIAFNYVGLTEWRQLIVIDPQFYRPSEVDFLRGDCTKAQEKLGWKAEYSLEDLVKMMIDAKL